MKKEIQKLIELNAWKYLNFEKPKKLRTTEEHNDKYIADDAPPGVYVPNMSEEDNKRWKCKFVGGDDKRIEIRKWLRGANMVITVYADKMVSISTNARLMFYFNEYSEFKAIIEEAKIFLEMEAKI